MCLFSSTTLPSLSLPCTLEKENSRWTFFLCRETEWGSGRCNLVAGTNFRLPASDIVLFNSQLPISATFYHRRGRRIRNPQVLQFLCLSSPQMTLLPAGLWWLRKAELLRQVSSKNVLLGYLVFLQVLVGGKLNLKTLLELLILLRWPRELL